MNEEELRAALLKPVGRREGGKLWAMHLRALGLPGRRVTWLDTPAEADRYVNRPSHHPELDFAWAVRWEDLCKTVTFHDGHPACSALMQKADRMVRAFIDSRALSEAWSTQTQWFSFIRSGVNASLTAADVPGGQWETVSRGAILPEPAPDSHAGGGHGNAWPPIAKILMTVGCAWVMKDEIICVPNPQTRLNAGGFLHAEDGPAVSWSGKENYWFWQGVRVPADVIEHPERITAPRILQEENAEVRAVMIERLGFARFVEEAGGRVIHSDRDAGGIRELIRVDLERGPETQWAPIDRFRLQALAVRCPSTGRTFVLRVPPAVTTCREAAAWTFGYDATDAYAPAVET